MRNVLLVLLLLALSGTAVAARRATKDLVNDLANPGLRTSAYRQLLKRKDPKAVYPLQGLLPNIDATGQYYGVLILAATGTKSAGEALGTLAKLGDPHLRVTAGAALYRKGDRSFILSMADALLTKDVPAATRTLMIRRLYAVPEPAIAAAAGHLLAANADHLVLYYALYLLHTQNAWRVAPQAVRILEDRRPAVRALGSSFLLRFGLEEHAGAAAKAIRDGKLDRTWWGRVRFYIGKAPRVAPVVLDAIAARLPDEADRSIVLSMIALLGQEEYRPGARALRKRLEDGDRTIAGAAFDALLKVPGGLTRERLAARLNDAEPAIRLKAVDALNRHDDPSGLPVAVAILASGAPADRREAARVISGFRTEAAVEPLIVALSDSRSDVRSTAEAGLRATLVALFPYRRLDFRLAGYHPRLAPEKTAAAVGRIRAWWKGNRTKDW